MSTCVTAVHPGASLYGENDASLLGICDETLEGEPQRVHVHAGENSNTHPDGDQTRPWTARRFSNACFQNRAGNPNFVHQHRPGIKPERGQWNG